MNVSRRVASVVRHIAVGAALVLLPTIAAGSPIPDLRMGLEGKASPNSTAGVTGRDVSALESLWSSLSGPSGALTGGAADGGSNLSAAFSSLGNVFAGGRGIGLSGGVSAPFGANAQSARTAPLTAGILQAYDHHREFANPRSAAALSATFPFGQFSGEDDDDGLAGAFHRESDRHAGAWATAWLNPGRALHGSEWKGDWDDHSGHLKIGKIDKAGKDDNQGKGNDNGHGSHGPATTITTVPEPASLLLLGTGAAALLATARRRKQDQ